MAVNWTKGSDQPNHQALCVYKWKLYHRLICASRATDTLIYRITLLSTCNLLFENRGIRGVYVSQQTFSISKNFYTLVVIEADCGVLKWLNWQSCIRHLHEIVCNHMENAQRTEWTIFGTRQTCHKIGFICDLGDCIFIGKLNMDPCKESFGGSG